MPVMRLFLFLILATALNPIIEAQYGPGDAFRSTTSASDRKARVDTFSSSSDGKARVDTFSSLSDRKARVDTFSSLSDGKARVTTYSSPDMLVPSVTYELIVNSTTLEDALFVKDIGLLYGLEVVVFTSEFVLNTLYQGQKPPPGSGKDYCEVEAIFESFSKAGVGGYPLEVASTVDNYIRINSDYLLNFEGDVRYEFTGIMYHESTHVWQWNGNGMAPAGLITGIADFVRLKAGLASVNWGKRGEGERWDQGFEVTAYFLEYLDKVKEGSVAKLNAMMKDYYYDFYFDMIYGTNVEILWIEYKLSSIIPIISPAPAPAPAV